MTGSDPAASEAAVVLVDTCVFMEHQPIEQIPWIGLLGVDRCRLVVPAVVCRELNDQKDHPRSDRKRERSRAALGRLGAVATSGDPICDGVEICVEFREAAAATFEREGLNSTIADEHVVGRAIEIAYQTGLPRAEITIASSDTPMIMKAKGHGFRALDLSEVRRLPVEKSEHQVARERAERRLTEIESARPSFDVKFADGSTELRLKGEPIPPASEEERERIFNEELSRAAKVGNLSAARAFVFSDPALLNRVQVRARARTVQLEREERWSALEARLTPVRVVVTNTTEHPATGLEVWLRGGSTGTFCLEHHLAKLRPHAISRRPELDDLPVSVLHPGLEIEAGVLELDRSFPSLLAKGSVEVLSAFVYFETTPPQTSELAWKVHCKELSGPQTGSLILRATGK